MEHPFRQRPNGQPLAGLWLAGSEGMEKKMKTTIMDFTGFRVQGLGLEWPFPRSPGTHILGSCP